MRRGRAPAGATNFGLPDSVSINFPLALGGTVFTSHLSMSESVYLFLSGLRRIDRRSCRLELYSDESCATLLYLDVIRLQ